MKILFVPDGGPAAGLGHLSRCLAVAQAISTISSIRPVFLSGDRESRAWLAERGLESSPYLQGNWDVMVVDSYARSPGAVAELRTQAKFFAVFDDIGTPPEDVHCVINSGVRASDVCYAAFRPRGLLLGPLFHPLRSEYLALDPDRSVTFPVRDILITLGGGTNQEMLSEILAELRLVFSLGRFHILIGPHDKQMRQFSDEQNLVIHYSPSNVRDVLALADIAISAGGQTLYELAYLGIPAIVIEIARNQHQNILGFTEAGTVISVGDAGLPKWKDRLREAFVLLLEEPGKRREMSEAGRQLIDGKGSLRLAKVLVT